MAKPRAVVIPFPAQGHVIPFFELSHCLVERGFHVTFVNTGYTHHQITTTSLAEKVLHDRDDIEMVVVPDGMAPEESRHKVDKHCESIMATMPGNLEKLLGKMGKEVACIIADSTMGWAVDVAKKMGIRSAALWTMPAALPALVDRIPDLIESNVMDANGFVASHQMIKLSAAMPPMNTKTFLWVCFSKEMQKSVFHYMYSSFKSAKTADHILCNTFREIEQEALELVPDHLPIGPLLHARRSGLPVGHFWPEDSSCLGWLDEQDTCSVVYVAFGSFTLLDQRQFHELALGLELTGKSFLWGVRPDIMDGSNGTFPNGFEARLGGRGKMVSWAPQQKVLAHPSIACFMSHCGWNSTMEGVANGVPFLCWPYFADQFLNASYICDVWKTGLRLEVGEDGFLTREEMKNKVGELLNDEDTRTRATKLREAARWNVDGGQSKLNFDQFMEGLRP